MDDRIRSAGNAVSASLLSVACFVISFGAVLAASDLDEFKVKREAVFEFAQRPVVTRAGDRVTIAFETKGLCDVTVAIEDADGKIVRHLACGVLGANAPEPFQKNARNQTIIWDGKDDQGVYLDDKDALTVRVSLGLKPRFERTLLWSPYRRAGNNTPVICPAPEGVYVFEGSGFDHVRLFDHEGKYVRTIYPFPADKVDAVQGVKRHLMPQSGRELPLKWGFYEATLLTSGYTGIWGQYGPPKGGAATNAMAVREGRIFLPCLSLNRIATDGSSGGMPFEGPKTTVLVSRHVRAAKNEPENVPPRSAALSPDGKTLYLAGFGWDNGWFGGGHEWVHGVAKMDPLGDKPPEPFAGVLKQGKHYAGNDNARLKVPSSVDVDARGRVYIADHMNDRVQVFSPDGTHLKAIPVKRPSEVAVHQRTGEIYVFSWVYRGRFYEGDEVPATLVRLGPVEDPRQLARYALPLRNYRGSVSGFDRQGGFQHRAAVDSWTDPPTIWLVPGSAAKRTGWEGAGILLLVEKDGALAVKRDFGREAARALRRLDPPDNQRQRLYVNPKTGTLYVGEGDGAAVGKSFHELIEVNPTTGRHRLVTIPFNAEDMAFDIDGRVYLRTLSEIVRYDPETWREVPFDYGAERERVGYGWMSGVTHKAPATAAILISTSTNWHQGGICVSPKGHIVVASYIKKMAHDRREDDKIDDVVLQEYTPTLFPGRGGAAVVHVFDEHGRVLYEDAIPGLGVLDGVGMDKDDNLYVLAAATRILDGKPYFDYMTGTAVKFRAREAKVITSSDRARIHLPAGAEPKRNAELADGGVGTAWAEGREWFYGGLGFTGKDGKHASGGCACWNTRFTLDYFARSFVPEIQHYTVGVLDTNGNLILRVGQYGNVDDGVPLAAGVRGQGSGVRNPDSSSPTPDTRNLTPDSATRSIGGDEVGLFYPAYLGTDTDRRLFIADPGNARIVSVKLNYHATERVALRGVPDAP